MSRHRAVLYRGTGCKKSFIRKASDILNKFGGFRRKDLHERCWIQVGKRTGSHFHVKKDIRYWHIKHFNVRRGHYTIALGHSAGGFPVAFTKATTKVGFNPFITQYPLLDVIFHAKDDWLVLKDRPQILAAQKLILYPGGHSKFPQKEFKDWVIDNYS